MYEYEKNADFYQNEARQFCLESKHLKFIEIFVTKRLI